MKKLLLSAAITVGLAASAAAQSTTTDWGGFYIGGTLSAMDGTLDYANPDFHYDLIGSTGLGGFAGYNFQRGRYVYGFELAYSDTGSGLSPVGFPGEDHTHLADIKLRAGIAVNKALFYGVLGRSETRFNHPAGPVTLDGLSYGIGVDAMITNHLFIGTELLVRDLDGPGNAPPQTRDSKIKALQVRIGWNF